MFQGMALNSEHYMSLLSARQKLVASNIANADTPGYHTQDINFQAEFENAMARPDAAVIEPEGSGCQTGRQQRQHRSRGPLAGGKCPAVLHRLELCPLRAEFGEDRDSGKQIAYEPAYPLYRSALPECRRRGSAPSCWWKIWRTPIPRGRRKAAPTGARMRCSSRIHRRRDFSSMFESEMGTAAFGRAGFRSGHRSRAILRSAICRGIPTPIKTATWRIRA